MAKLRGKTALVTGAGRGIGRATALLFAQEGATLIIVSRTEQELAQTVQLCQAEGAQVYWRSLDVADLQQVDNLFADLSKQVTRIDILVNNAAMFDKGLISGFPVDRFRAMLATNVMAPMYLAQKTLALMDAQSGGAIVNVSSLSGCVGAEKFPGFGAYNISKYALWGLTEILAVEEKERNVRVNQVSLTGVDTEMFHRAVPPGVAAVLSPEDVARKILFLASDDSGGLTGENVLLTEKPGDNS